MPFYVGLGYLKAAVIAEGIHACHVDGLTVGTGFETVGAAVPLLLAEGLRMPIEDKSGVGRLRSGW